ncbi:MULTISPECIES: dynamin family protein [unclassified Agrococcus]|uniref:dynamin family protein n=1 Tax=unclassified Agrococcus TaxID=2615065 RepID=UPI00360CC215
MTEATIAALERLASLRGALDATRLPLAVEGVDAARDLRSRVLRQIDDYVEPRLANLDAPLLAVVGGSTGAGKSTLVNALVGLPVTRTGVIRPTTRQPILLHAPSDRGWFASTRILPELARVSGEVRADPLPASTAGDEPDATRIGSVVLVGHERVPADLAIVDAPDLDSVADENRALAGQLLAAADLWLFVTTANRYADAVPWAALEDAAGRDVTVGVVLNRVPRGAADEVEHDLRRMLGERGLGAAPVFTVVEAPLDDLGMLPADAVADIRGWLTGIAGDRAERARIAGRTLGGAATRLAASTREVAAARALQVGAADELDRVVQARYADAADRIHAATSDGALLRGEVLARWQDFVGTSDVFRTIEGWFSRTRDRIGAFLQGRPAPVVQVETAIEHGLHAVVVDEAGGAAGDAWQRVRATQAGRQLTAGVDLSREGDDLAGRTSRLVREWQAALVQRISDQAGDKRVKARILSLGLNAVTVTLMVIVFASTGGLTGGELAIAGGSAVVGQKLLETVFGEDAVRRMAQEARADLDERVTALLAEESDRYAPLLDPVREGTSPAQLEDASHDLERAMGAVASEGAA